MKISTQRRNTALSSKELYLPIKVSGRELEVLQKMSEGLTVKEIANCLNLSTHTIISHKKNLQAKFRAKNAVELAVKAIRFQVLDI